MIQPRLDNSMLGKLQGMRNEIQRTAAAHGASNIRVFGSVARGEERENSDIDFLVDMKSGSTLFDVGDLYAELQDLLHRPVEVMTLEEISPVIRDRVLAESVPL